MLFVMCTFRWQQVFWSVNILGCAGGHRWVGGELVMSRHTCPPDRPVPPQPPTYPLLPYLPLVNVIHIAMISVIDIAILINDIMTTMSPMSTPSAPRNLPQDLVIRVISVITTIMCGGGGQLQIPGHSSSCVIWYQRTQRFLKSLSSLCFDLRH